MGVETKASYCYNTELSPPWGLDYQGQSTKTRFQKATNLPFIPQSQSKFFFFPLKIKKLMDRVKDFISYFFELNISFLLVNNVGNKDHNLSLSTPLKLAIAVCLFFPPDDFWIWLTVVTVRFLALFHPGWVIQNLFQMTRRYDEWGSKAFLLLDRKFFSDVAQMEVLLIRELCRDADLSPRKILAGLFWQTWASMGPA